MFDWLRKFFYSDDPVVKIASGLNEPEAEMLRELLDNRGIPAPIKNMRFLSVTYGWSTGNEFDMYARRSDAEEARAIIAPLVRPGQLVQEDT